MSHHTAAIYWKRATPTFTYDAYNRDHEWRFDNGVKIAASATQAYRGNPANIDPEEAYVASLSSCHMLTFLALCSRAKFVVDTYEDTAEGLLEKNAAGKLAITKVVLRPKITFSGDKVPNSAELENLHHRSHEECFIANSVNTVVSVEEAS